MARKLLSRNELAAWLTAAIQKFEDCKEVKIGGVMPLQEPDDEGVNWSDQIVVTTGGTPSDIYFNPLQKVMAEARARFNLKEDD